MSVFIERSVRRSHDLKLRLVKHMQDRSTEWLSALVMVSWGITLMMPGDTLLGPLFIAFKRYGLTEDFWAWAFTSVGVARLTALWINGRWPRTPTIRSLCAIFGATSWVHVSYLLYQGSAGIGLPWSTGPGVYLILAFYDFIAIFRAAVDGRYQQPK
jgi:hypothetical protein